MQKLALSDELLLSVDKPARYIGGEVNAVMKDAADIDIRIAMCFPDVYEIGMSHLGIQILYDMFNRREDVWCERVYSPWPDMDSVLRREHIPLFTLESQTPVRSMDILGITLQYEMCYTNILQVLDLSFIPLLACERSEDDPIVIGGGPCTYNPEPIADFFDLFYIGEGEVSYDRLLDLYKECRDEGWDRKAFLLKAARIPGIYVPSLYNVEYNADGTLRSMTPAYEGVPATIERLVVTDLDGAVYPERPVVPYLKATQDRCVLEIQRGCIRGCRFCQAGMVYRPLREKNVETLKKNAVNIINSTGHDEISLSSLSSSDYSQLKELVYFLIDEFGSKDINISLPSLRIDAFSLDVMSKVQDIKKSSLTFAPEAGTQRMRDVINKGLTEEVILEGAAEAFKGGWNKVKLYFMLGLPTETKEDMEGIADLADKVAMTYYDTVPKEKRQGRVQVTASTSFFIPKPFTPLQWAPMYRAEEYLARARTVNAAIKAAHNHKSLRYMWHEADVSVIEGIFARGDRRVSKAILAAYKKGCMFDAWSEYFDNDKWMEAFDETGITLEFYALRERDLDELFPWDFIDIGVSKSFLKREWKNAMDAKVTKNCREQCQGCGARKFNGGVCFERETKV